MSSRRLYQMINTMSIMYNLKFSPKLRFILWFNQMWRFNLGLLCNQRCNMRLLSNQNKLFNQNLRLFNQNLRFFNQNLRFFNQRSNLRLFNQNLKFFNQRNNLRLFNQNARFFNQRSTGCLTRTSSCSTRATAGCPARGAVVQLEVQPHVDELEVHAKLELQPKLSEYEGKSVQVANEVVVEDMDPNANVDDGVAVDGLVTRMTYTLTDPEVEFKDMFPSGTKYMLRKAVGGFLVDAKNFLNPDDFWKFHINVGGSSSGTVNDVGHVDRAPSPELEVEHISYSSEEELATPHDVLSRTQVLMLKRKEERSRLRRKFMVDNAKPTSRGGLRQLDTEATHLQCDGELVKLSMCSLIPKGNGELCDQIPLLNAKDDKATERVAMWGMHPSRVNAINLCVMIVQKGHWWCAAFSRNHEEILVLDSLVTTKAVDYHKSEVLKMVEVVDQVFHTLDEGWPTKTITKWPMTSLSMTPQSDGHSCGIHMLHAIKCNAERFQATLPIVSKHA
uniref:Ubiquitin-like protease family profile domain-containing protein n=1 Tax=Chenopodium quinoa TaxID=63459 RepID=A0A803LVY0_CHEQI